MASHFYSSSLIMDDPNAYSNSSSPFALFQNSAYHSMEPSSPSLQIQTHDIHSQSMYSSLSNYNGSGFSPGAADSPASSSGSVSLNNSDDSPADSPIMIDHHPGDHPNGFDYDHEMFEQHLKSMFTPPFTDYSCGSGTGSNERFNVNQEHQQPQLYDSYQPYMDTSTKSLPYQHQHTTLVDSSEHFENNPETTPSLTYGFSNGYQNPSAPLSASASSQNLIDSNSNFLLQATATQPRFTAMRFPGIIPQQPCAQPTQLSPQCVNVVELSPSPPVYAATDLPDTQVCDPRFVSGQRDDNAQVHQTEASGQPGKLTSDLSTPCSIAAQSPPSYSGSQVSEEDWQQDDGMDDDDYQASLDSEAEADDDSELLSRFTRSTRAGRRASASGALPFPSYSSSYDPDDVHESSIGIATKRPRGLSAPIPVPNLTKKSRGRRVPTASLIASQGVGKNVRSYMCKVKDCGKCFARGEHLKRHVRSIHTNDKPHKCPVPGCSKEFSRHDNLGQHLRVHKGYKVPTED